MNRFNTLSAPDKVRIQIILDSTREGRFGDRGANWFFRLATEREDLTAELIDLRDWLLPFFNEPVSPITDHYAPEARTWVAKVG